MIFDNSENNFQKLSLSKTSSTSKTTAFNGFFFFFSLQNIQLNMRRSFHICNFFLNDEKNLSSYKYKLLNFTCHRNCYFLRRFHSMVFNIVTQFKQYLKPGLLLHHLCYTYFRFDLDCIIQWSCGKKVFLHKGVVFKVL